MKKVASLLVLLFCTAVFAATPSQSIEIRPGEPLRDVLDRLAAVGLNVISTRRVVPSRMQVIAQPDKNLPILDQVAEILSAHDLQLVMVDAQNGYVKKVSLDALSDAGPNQVGVPARSDENPIEELIVTSHYQVRRQRELAANLNHKDLLNLPSLGRDVLRGIEALPGVTSNGISARHRFRGGDSNEVLYRLDGIELLEPFHLPSVQDLFGVVNLNIVDSADVYVAGFPVDLGSRMSGVVDLELIEPTEKFSGGIDLNLITAAADAQGWFGGWSWVASARRSTIDWTISKFETDYGTPRFQDELLRITHTSPTSQFTFGAMNSRDRVVVQQRSEFGRSQDDFQSLWLRWQQDHTENLSSTWQLSSTTIEKSRQGRVDDSTSSVGEILEEREFDTFELNNRWTWQILPTTRLDAGGSYARQKADFNADFFAQYGELALPTLRYTSVLREVEVDRSGESIQGYLSLTHQLTPRWTIETGFRYDGQDIDPVHVNELSARFHVDFKASERWHFALDVGRYTQQQHLFEIQIDDGKAELDEPQNSDQINLTSIFRPDDKVRLRLDIFVRNIDNPWSHFENLYNQWVLIPELQGDRFEVQATKARVHGAELTLSYQVSDELSWFVHTAHTQARETSLSKERPRPWQQENTVKAGVSWQAPPWKVGINAVYRSGLPTTPFLETESEFVSELYGDELPAFISLDAHVSRQIPVPRGRMEVYLDITNLTDRSNVGGYDYRLNDRRKPQSMLPMLPVFGLTWRW